MKALKLPVALPIWGLVSLKITRPELRSMLGEPHYIETDPHKTCGGEEDAWAYELPSGQGIAIVLDVTSGWAELFGDPPVSGPILEVLGIAPDDVRIRHHEPVEMN